MPAAGGRARALVRRARQRACAWVRAATDAAGEKGGRAGAMERS